MKKKRLYQILNTYMDIFEMMVLKSSFLLSSILHLFDQKYSKTLTLWNIITIYNINVNFELMNRMHLIINSIWIFNILVI